MQRDIKFAGFGGQGIMMMGKILAHAAMEEGLEVAWVPSYGPEMRGGTAYCTVVMGDRPIGSPIIKNPMHLVAMNGPSLEKFIPSVRKGGVVFVNSSLINFGADRDDVDEFRVPVVKLAQELGKWAEDQGRGDSFHMAVFLAYFHRGENIALPENLLRICKDVGLDIEAARKVLDRRTYREAVDRDWQLARHMRITAVPTFVMGERRLVGAQSYSALEALVQSAGGRRRRHGR